MNISNRAHLIHPAENPYRRFQPLTGLNTSQGTNSDITKAGGLTAKQTVTAPADILSSREKETLQALFSGKTKEHLFYGTTKVGNIQSGYLLDIKG